MKLGGAALRSWGAAAKIVQVFQFLKKQNRISYAVNTKVEGIEAGE